MDSAGMPQPPYHHSQASEGNSFIAPLAPHREEDISCTTSQTSQYDIYPGSQSMPSGRPGPSTELSSLQELPQDSQWGGFGGSQPSAPALQPFSTVPPSLYAPDQNHTSLALLNSVRIQHYVPSQAPYQYALPSSYPVATTSSGHPIPRQRHSERDTTTSFTGAEESFSGHNWSNDNGDDLVFSSMDDPGRHIDQGYFTEPCNHGGEQRGSSEVQHNLEQRIVNGNNALRGIGEVNYSDEYDESDSMSRSLNCRPATDKREAFGDNAIQTWNPAPTENTLARPGPWSTSQEIDDPVVPSTSLASGLDPNLLNESFPRVYDSFVGDADMTNIGAFNSRQERLPRHLGDYDDHSPSGSSTSQAPRYDTGSRNILSPTASDTRAYLDYGANRPVAPEPWRSCKLCDEDPSYEPKPVFSSGVNKARHMRESHPCGPINYHKCLLSNKDGSACKSVIKITRNRRKHVESLHKGVSRELPSTSKVRRPNGETDKMLDKWFTPQPQSSTE